MIVDQENLRRKNEELGQALREKSRKHSQIQELYDKLKRQGMLSQVQSAALDSIDNTLQVSAVSNLFMDHTPNLSRARQLPLFPDLQGNKTQHSSLSAERGALPSIPPPIAGAGLSDSWNTYNSQESSGRTSAYMHFLNYSNQPYRA